MADDVNVQNETNPEATPKAAPKKSAAAKPRAAKTTVAPLAPSPGITEDTNGQGSNDNANDGSTKSKVKNEMNNFKNKAADGARAAAEKGKDRATEAVSSISKLIRDSAATIDGSVGVQYGDYARSAADSVDSLVGKIDAKEIDDIVADAREFVRKSPAVAIGAAAAIGFVLTRLVRSSRDDV